jgi:ribonuclease HI
MYYAVAIGRKTGIYTTWAEAKKEIDGFHGARYKKFKSKEDAESFIKGNGSLILGQFGITNIIPTISPSLNSQVSPHPNDALIVFTDGACKGNGSQNAKAGYAAVFPNHPNLDISESLQGDTKTNNRAEYMAGIRAIEQCNIVDPKYNKPLYIYTDSMLLLNTATRWIKNWKLHGWKKNDGGPILNLDLIIRLDKLIMLRKIIWRHVSAHTGNNDWLSIWNAKADEKANEACT